jgi:hypothetical protein
VFDLSALATAAPPAKFLLRRIIPKKGRTPNHQNAKKWFWGFACSIGRQLQRQLHQRSFFLPKLFWRFGALAFLN